MKTGEKGAITNRKILMQYFKFNPVHQSLVLLPSLGLSTYLKNIKKNQKIKEKKRKKRFPFFWRNGI